MSPSLGWTGHMCKVTAEPNRLQVVAAWSALGYSPGRSFTAGGNWLEPLLFSAAGVGRQVLPYQGGGQGKEPLGDGPGFYPSVPPPS